jgi:hypothetical protein
MGASEAQVQLQDAQIAAYKQAQDMTAKQYADQQAIYAPMAKQFQSIFDKGPNQKGFSDEQTNTLNAQAVEGTAENYSQAAKAVGNSLASEGGGDAYMPSGGADQLKQEVANSAAANESSQETQIVNANYAEGLQQWNAAAGGLETIAAGDNPLGYEQAATSAGSAASTTANEISQEDNSWINATIGAAGAVGAGWATGGFKT